VPETDFASTPGGTFRRNLSNPVPSLFPPGYGEENCPSLAGAATSEEHPSTTVTERKDGPSRTTSGSGFLSEEENNLSDPAEETAGTVALFPAQRR